MKILKGISIFMLIIVIIILTIIVPIDFTPLDQQPAVQNTYQTLDKTTYLPSKGNGILTAGWARTNITPQSPIHMAGYGPRGPYISVHDSLYARSVVFDNGEKEVVMIGIDLLLFPRIVKHAVQDSLSNYGFSPSEIFLNATHTHSGFGNWEKSTGGKFIFGDYDKENVAFLTQQILKSVKNAIHQKYPVKIGYEKINAGELVYNRLAKEKDTKDPFLRVISLKRENGQMAIITSFSGHPTNLDADIWEISRDYPGVLVDDLENENAIEFAMFCAGMMGSHSINIDMPKSPKRILNIGQQLSNKIKNRLDAMDYMETSTLGGLDISIDMPPSQMRLTSRLGIRDWLFSKLLGPLQANVKLLEIGDVLLIGMPCDFSGELSINNNLDQFAAERGKQLFITSFNGNYVGYITEDKHYTTSTHDEVITMNWVGPYKGAYFAEVIKKLIAVVE